MLLSNRTGLGNRGGDGVEAIKPPGDRHQVRPLRLERLPGRLVGPLGALVRLGVGDTAVEQQPIQLLIARHPQSRREEAFAHQPNLVLDLPLLPSRRRRARHRLNEVMGLSNLMSGLLDLARSGIRSVPVDIDAI